MKAEGLVEQGGMVLMITHPDYLCHHKLVRSKQKGVGRRYDGWLGDENREQRSEDRGRKTEVSLKREDEKVKRLATDPHGRTRTEEED
jgi:hypothetical protein